MSITSKDRYDHCKSIDIHDADERISQIRIKHIRHLCGDSIGSSVSKDAARNAEPTNIQLYIDSKTRDHIEDSRRTLGHMPRRVQFKEHTTRRSANGVA
jgi:hypothetical protein